VGVRLDVPQLLVGAASLAGVLERRIARRPVVLGALAGGAARGGGARAGRRRQASRPRADRARAAGRRFL
jgi:hypothetical protein